MNKYEDKYLVSIDLGTSKIDLCVALLEGKRLKILYHKATPSSGIQTSSVYVPMQAQKAVEEAIADAEKELMIKITRSVVSLPRNDVEQASKSATIERDYPDDYVSAEELKALKEMALKSFPLDNPQKQFTYAVVPQSYIIDEDEDEWLPEKRVIGTIGPTLKGNYNVYIGRKKTVAALERVFSGLKVDIAKKYFLPEVMGKAMLSKEDLKYGVALVDIGAGVTTLSIYREGALRYCVTIPFGGYAVTRDLEEECSIEWDLAEKIKKRFGICMPDKLGKDKDRILQVRLTEPYTDIPVKYISEVITARYKEIADAVAYYIQESGYQRYIRGGIVLTGGASAQQNIDILFKDVTGYNVRRAKAGSTAALAMVIAAADEDVVECANDAALRETLFDEAKENEEDNQGVEETLPPESGKDRPDVFKLVWDTVQGFLKKTYDEFGQE